MKEYALKYFEYLQSLDYSGFLLNKEYWTIIIVSHIIWWGVYGFIHFFINVNLKKKKLIYDTKTRIVSIIHASLVFCLCVYDVIFYQRDKCGQPNYFFQNFILLISFSYFAYDLIVCILLDVSDIEMVLHHSFVMLGYYAGIAFNNSASEMMRALVVAEVSNPIMHLRVIIKNFGLKYTKIHILLDFIYMAIYLVARMIYGTKVILFVVFCWNNLVLVKIAGLFVWVQSFIFSRRMVHMIKHRYREYRELKKKNVKLFWFEHNKQVEDMEFYKIAMQKRATYIP